MRVFVTGASGFIGSAVVPELLAAGHRVVGLARSDPAAAALAAAGAEVRRGHLDDLDGLRAGAAESDGVVHLAYKHDLSNWAGAGRTERAAVQTLGAALEGSGRPLLLASGVAHLSPGRVVTERDRQSATGPDAPRGGAEGLALDLAGHGVRSVALRFGVTVHGEGDHGFMAVLADVARRRGVAGYVGDGSNRWPAVHRSDVARLVRLALEGAPAGSAVHAIAEGGIPARTIAEELGRQLDVPAVSIPEQDVDEHFGWIGRIFALDIPASAELTREQLAWTPTGPTLADDLRAGHYGRADARR